MTDDAPLPPTDPAPPRPRAMRPGLRLKVLLFASLAANLLVAGFVIGVVVLGGPGGRDGPPRLRDAGLGPLVGVLSGEERRGLREALERRAPELREARSQMRGALRELLGALRADPFDAGRLSQALAHQRQVTVHVQEIGQHALIERIAQASPEDRSAFADRIEHALRRGADR